jgi:Zn-dependent protease with chaperone function
MQALTFIARGLSVSLAVFVLLYVALGLLVSRIWAPVTRWTSSLSVRRTAGILFFLRMVPLLVSSLVTLAVTLPSFLLLEPRSTDEEIGIAPLLLGLCCLALIVVGVRRAIMAQRKTSQALAGWLRGANRIESNISIPVFQTGADSPSLTVAGVCTPVVLVSESAVALLNEREFQTALRHEIAHVASRDNFKKLLFRLTSFPGMAGLETAWSDAAEMSADDAAVSNLNDALDLAAALIKLSRLAPVQATATLTTALLQSSSATLSARVQRLFAWNSRPASGDRRASTILLPSLLATLVCLALTYSSVLAGMHAATEWLVR